VLGNLYSGTFKRFAMAFPRVLQKSHKVISNVTRKILENPLGKGLEVHSTDL